MVDLAYLGGSPYVEVLWGDYAVARSRFLHAPDGTFETVPQHRADMMNSMAAEGAAMVNLSTPDPDAFADVDPSRVGTFERAWASRVQPTRKLMGSFDISWSAAHVASPAWARKVYPNLSEAAALSALWDIIFKTTRVTEADPVAAWQRHNSALARRREALTTSQYAALRFTGPGTDLRVGLPGDHIWNGGAAALPSGAEFVPNLPTEEVYTAPHRERVAGTVRASMPLVSSGMRIEEFSLRFEGGVVVEAIARQGQPVLDEFLGTDAGACRLGEVALVASSNPIGQAGLLFYDSLYDENAASHIALGAAYTTCVRGGREMSEEELLANGLNHSLTHVDFMIGSSAMDVDGEFVDGSTEPVMRQGEWID